MTVLEAIQRSTEFFTRKGVESPRLQAELLLAHVLQLPRMQLYLRFEQALDDKVLETLREAVKRRAAREPLQHIVGSTSFCGLDMAVSNAVLVPRPETELLAEAGWEFLRQKVRANGGKRVFALDWGTGSGCIAIALAFHCAEAEVVAIDCSAAALAVAVRNADRHKLAGRIHFLNGDGVAAIGNNECFDLIISNPPYIPSSEIETLDPEVRDHDPRGALDGGSDGLECYRRIALETGKHLAAGGKLMLEFGDGQAEALSALLTKQNWIVEAIREDYTHRPRILIASKSNG